MSPAHCDPTPNDPRPDLGLLDVHAVAELTGLGSELVRKLVYGRRLPTVRIGGRVFVRRTDLAEWIDANTKPAREARP